MSAKTCISAISSYFHALRYNTSVLNMFNGYIYNRSVYLTLGNFSISFDENPFPADNFIKYKTKQTPNIIIL